jgi:hypothetical protein
MDDNRPLMYVKPLFKVNLQKDVINVKESHFTNSWDLYKFTS